MLTIISEAPTYLAESDRDNSHLEQFLEYFQITPVTLSATFYGDTIGREMSAVRE